MSDRHGRRGTIVAATYGAALSCAILATAPDWRLAVVGVALAGAFSSLSQPALQAITADSATPERRGLGYALVSTLPSAPAMLAPLAAALLVEHNGLVPGTRLIYWLGALLGLAAASLRALWLEETLRCGARPAGLLAELGGSVTEVLAALRGMSRPLATLTLVLLVNSVEESMLRFMPLYVVDVAGISEAEWAMLSSIFPAVPLVAGVPMGGLVDSIGRRRAMLLAYALWVPSTLCLVYCRSLPEFALVFAAFALGASLFTPAHQAMVADLTPRAARGRVMGTVGMLRLLTAAPASALAGLLYEMQPESPFLLVAALGVVNAVLIASLVAEPARREE